MSLILVSCRLEKIYLHRNVICVQNRNGEKGTSFHISHIVAFFWLKIQVLMHVCASGVSYGTNYAAINFWTAPDNNYSLNLLF